MQNTALYQVLRRKLKTRTAGLSRNVGRTSRGPFQPKQSRDSVLLCSWVILVKSDNVRKPSVNPEHEGYWNSNICSSSQQLMSLNSHSSWFVGFDRSLMKYCTLLINEGKKKFQKVAYVSKHSEMFCSYTKAEIETNTFLCLNRTQLKKKVIFSTFFIRIHFLSYSR